MTKKLWNDYSFLTREMARFLENQEYDLFFELMRQRELIQESIDNCVEDGFKSTEEGQRIIEDIHDKNQVIIRRLQININNMKHKQAVNIAYDGSVLARPVGIRLDRQG